MAALDIDAPLNGTWQVGLWHMRNGALHTANADLRQSRYASSNLLQCVAVTLKRVGITDWLRQDARRKCGKGTLFRWMLTVDMEIHGSTRNHGFMADGYVEEITQLYISIGTSIRVLHA